MKGILEMMNLFNEEYKKNWNRELQLKGSGNKPKCIEKEVENG